MSFPVSLRIHLEFCGGNRETNPDSYLLGEARCGRFDGTFKFHIRTDDATLIPQGGRDSEDYILCIHFRPSPLDLLNPMRRYHFYIFSSRLDCIVEKRIEMLNITGSILLVRITPRLQSLCATVTNQPVFHSFLGIFISRWLIC